MSFPRTHWRRLIVCLVAALLVLAASASLAEIIVLQSGEEHRGAIVHATRNTVVVQRGIGGTHQASLAEIREVRITTDTGAEVAGSLLAWSDGVYVIRSGNEVIEVRGGQILSVAPAPASQPKMVYVPVANVVSPNASVVEAPGASRPVEMAKSPAPAAPAEQQPKDSEPTLAITIAAEPVIESSPELLFEIELSQPAEQSIVVMYATMDGTAQGGVDYEPRQGAVIIELVLTLQKYACL
ncbi:MAG: hypothetical protein OET79_09115 [Nitrospirota bacterium]|nr:hypothetical protein [Nitrospirota bacterium]